MKPKLDIGPLAGEVERRLNVNRAITRSTTRVHVGPTSERALFGAVNGDETAAHKAWRRAKRHGMVTLDALDDLCVYLDVHPRELYGDAYDQQAYAGALPPDYIRTDQVPRDLVALVRTRLAEPREDPWWWHAGRRGLPRATRRF
jgi:hypothetical protein